MDPYEETIARLRARYSGPELQARIRTVRRRQVTAEARSAQFDAALAEVLAEAAPVPDDELPFERTFRQAHNRLKARLRAGLIDLPFYEGRLAAVSAIRDERAAKWHKHTPRRPTGDSKASARIQLRAVRARLR
ncbi:hypothetical protein ACWFMI_23380 [Nocardiopsis terrae]|uniref:hypothetical protein n=1 Tax=Streptomyces sp. NPDC057554 TaxID=3350538 RepID=UPI0036B3E878